MKNIILRYSLSLMCVFVLGGVVLPVHAADPQTTPPESKTALDRLQKTGSGVYGGTGQLQEGAFEKTIGKIINIALSLVGVIFLILTVYGGYIWMIARGDETEAKKAKDIITMAVIGLAVVLAAYAITNFVVTRLTNAASNTVQ